MARTAAPSTRTKTRKPSVAKRPTKSPEERAAEARAARERLQDAVAALATTDQWSRYLTQLAAFRGFSANNTMLIFLQRPDATLVTKLSNWNKLNRRVTKGETGIRIFGQPRVFTKTVLDARTGLDKEEESMHWPIVSVFDISQTNGEPLADSVTTDLMGSDPHRITERATRWLEGNGWTVCSKTLSGQTKGYTSFTDREVVTDDRLSPAMRAYVLLHEAAHVLLHGDLAAGEYQQHRGRCEVEADGAAFVAASMLGLDSTPASVGYIAGWARGNAGLIGEVADRIQKTATAIADAIDGVTPWWVAE